MMILMVRGFSRTATTRNLLAGFILITALPVAALLWLGFELASQDRLLQAQRDAERRELVVGRVVGALEKLLIASEHELDLGAPVATGAIRIRLSEDRVEVRPPEGIPYYPVMPPMPEAPQATFEAAENLEFRQGDTAAAIEALRRQALSPNQAVRAGALLRLARNLRKANRVGEALSVYQQLAQCTGVAVPAHMRGMSPAVSPDGTQIAFEGTVRDWQLWVMNGLLPETKPAAAR